MMNVSKRKKLLIDWIATNILLNENYNEKLLNN